MSSLENDNEFIVFVSYIVDWERPLINRIQTMWSLCLRLRFSAFLWTLLMLALVFALVFLSVFMDSSYAWACVRACVSQRYYELYVCACVFDCVSQRFYGLYLCLSLCLRLRFSAFL